MKLKSLLLSLLIMVTTVAVAQVEDGKAYRIVNSQYSTVITEGLTTHQLVCVTTGTDTDYQQMWMFEKQDDGRFFIKNVFTNRYVQNESGTNVLFKTGTAGVAFAIKANASKSGLYNIDASSKDGGWGLHCASGGNVVPWSYGPDSKGETPSEWIFEEVAISAEEIANAPLEYEKFLATFSQIDEIEAGVVKYFEDKACTVLKAEYAAMSDAELLATMENLPADLQAAIIKIKNNSWDTVTREAEFRVYDYKPYSNPEYWADELNLRPFNRINNPTGICTASDREFLYVFVDKIPAGTTMTLAQMQATKYFGTDTELHVGLNVVPAAYKNGSVFVRYVCATEIGKKKLEDYPTVKVHVEGGYVNGFWSKERGHTNADWKYFQEHMFKNPESVIAVGDLTMLNFRKAEFLEPFSKYDEWGYKVEGCHTNIEEVMALWDFWNTSQQKNMGLDKYWPYFNNKQLAMSDDGGFMDAGNYRTHYNNNTLTTIVNYDRVTRDGGSAWGPNHEIGHTNQYAFQIVGTSEVSNNALANFAIFEVGTHTSRGNNLENQILDFENNVPYVARGEKKYGQKLFSMTRMYFQLYLYFHAAGKDKTFYPRLFDALREDPIIKYSTNECDRSICEDGEGAPLTNKEGYILGSMNAKNDQLKFIEKCCEVAQMDLTEFFEAWGFFIPFKNLYVSDYGHYHVYLTQGAIDSCKAAIKEKNYPKKGGHLMFLEDRVRPSKKIASAVNSDVTNYRIDYSWEVPVGTVGDYGQWEDYIDESVKAEGYYYVISNNEVSIMLADDANGALGFKLYDENGKLLTYTNRKKMKVPMSAIDKQLVVVAAQADGADVVLKPASEGPAEMQIKYLSSKLEEVRNALAVKSKDGNEIGYYRPAAMATLETLYKDAKNAYDNQDVTTHSYAEWSVILESELAKVNSDDANRILFEENMYAYFSNGSSSYSSQCLSNGNTELAGASYSNGAETNPKMGWTIEYAGKPGEYYIKDRNGFYIKNVEIEQPVSANVSTSALAAKFNIIYNTNGTVVFTPVSNPAVAFGLQNSTKIVGMSPNDPAASWLGYVIEDKSAAHYKAELEAAMEKAYFTVTEVINFENLNEMNFFNDNIVVSDRNLETYIMDLYNAYVKILDDKDNAAMCKAYLAELRDLFYKIDGSYFVKSPIVTKAEDVVIYRILNKEDGTYLSVLESTLSMKKNSLTTVKAKDVDDDCLWSFAPAPRGMYQVYNHGKDYFMYKKPATSTYLYVNDEATSVAMSYKSDKNGVVLYIDNKPLVASSSSVKLGSDKNYTVWELELVSIEKNKELADLITVVEKVLTEADMNDDIYDLNGRKVLVPTNGIYIQNGKKVYVK